MIITNHDSICRFKYLGPYSPRAFVYNIKNIQNYIKIGSLVQPGAAAPTAPPSGPGRGLGPGFNPGPRPGAKMLDICPDLAPGPSRGPVGAMDPGQAQGGPGLAPGLPRKIWTREI